jgi:cystathionine beta-lyase
MTYDFDAIVPRRHTNSIKWDAVDAVLPMWVADMDFKTAQPVIDALVKRAQHGVFGYTKLPDAYYDAISGWFGRRYKLTVQKDWILATIGVVPAISAIIKALTVPGDKVILQSPVYNCFFSSIRNNGCEVVSNDLVYANGNYSIDFAGLEAIAAEPNAKLLLLCNPHNPVGRVWTRDELTQLGDICIRNGVTILSDEIHCDLVYQGYKHLPFAAISDDFLRHSVTCTSPSKTFNLAGLQAANIFVADGVLRSSINKALSRNEIREINSFGVDGLIAAYNQGEEWLQQLLAYLYNNYLLLKDFFATHLPQLPVLPLQATYLVWIDCAALHRSSAELADTLMADEKLWLNKGLMYGSNGDHFLRINIACPRTLLVDGLNKINHAFGNQAATQYK